MTSFRHASTGLLLALASFLVHAQPQGGPPPGGAGTPPPEAIEACKGKTAGAQASFTDRSGRTVAGTCGQVGSVLAVRPAGGPPPGAASGAAR